MRAIQTRACLSAVVRAALITECLLTNVRGDGSESEEKLDIKYVLIGCGLGLFLVAMFIITKICIIRKQVCENSTESFKRPSEPNLVPLNHLGQSEHPVVAVSNDELC